MKDVRLNNGTTMTDEQFVMERGMGDTITDFVPTKADLELLAQALVNRLLFDEFVLMQQVSRAGYRGARVHRFSAGQSNGLLT